MARLEVEKSRAIASGVRSLEVVSLEVGDQFTFPTEYEVYEQKINGNTAQYIWITLVNGNAKKFYPSTFTKSRIVCDEDGTPTGERKYTTGTAAEEYRRHGTVDEAMRALAGRTVKVTNIEIIRTLRFGTTSVMSTPIPTIDFVDSDNDKSVLHFVELRVTIGEIKKDER